MTIASMPTSGKIWMLFILFIKRWNEIIFKIVVTLFEFKMRFTLKNNLIVTLDMFILYIYFIYVYLCML